MKQRVPKVTRVPSSNLGERTGELLLRGGYFLGWVFCGSASSDTLPFCDAPEGPVRKKERKSHVIRRSMAKLDSFTWGPLMLILLVGTGIYLSGGGLHPVHSASPRDEKHLGQDVPETEGRQRLRSPRSGRHHRSAYQSAPATLPALPAPSRPAAPAPYSGYGCPPCSEWSPSTPVVLAIRFRERQRQRRLVVVPCITLKRFGQELEMAGLHILRAGLSCRLRYQQYDPGQHNSASSINPRHRHLRRRHRGKHRDVSSARRPR